MLSVFIIGIIVLVITTSNFFSIRETEEMVAISWAAGDKQCPSSSLSPQLPEPSQPDTSQALRSPLWLCKATFCLWEQNQISSLHPDGASLRDRQSPGLKGAIL